MNESIRLGRVAGVRVGANWSLLPIFLLIAWSLAVTLLPAAAPGYAASAYWLFALLTTAAFYASLLAHELAHAVVARRHGVNVNSIVLWVLGGVAQLEGDTPDPRAEFQVAAAGPATSFGIAATAGIATAILAGLGVSSLIVAAIGWLAGINVLLGLFNLIPAFPLDGGRILRAALWHRWHDRLRATTAAGRVGRAAGFVLIGIGAIEFLSGGGLLSGVWLAVIGWFIVVAAQQQPELIRRQHEARGLTVSEAMTRDPVVVPAGASVAEAIERYVLANRFSSFPVADADGGLVGLASVQRMAELPRESWANTPVTTWPVTRSDVLACSPDDRLDEIGARLQSAPDRRAVVVQGGRVVGIVTPSDVARAMNSAEPSGDAWTAPSGRRGMAWGRARQV